MIDLSKTSKKGFTLIELVVALAIFLVIITMAFSAISSLLRVRVAYDQETVLQQNFRFAVDSITDEFRQANKDPNASYNITIAPDDLSGQGNAMGEKLIFTEYDGANTNYVRFRLESNSSGNALYKGISNDGGTTYSEQPVTENMKQLIKIYFVRAGGKVAVIMVGTIDYFGQKNTISYTSLIYSRNSDKQY